MKKEPYLLTISATLKILRDECTSKGIEHSGIVLSEQLPVGVLLKRVMKLWFSLKADEMKNRLEFLSNWK